MLPKSAVNHFSLILFLKVTLSEPLLQSKYSPELDPVAGTTDWKRLSIALLKLTRLEHLEILMSRSSHDSFQAHMFSLQREAAFSRSGFHN